MSKKRKRSDKKPPEKLVASKKANLEKAEAEKDVSKTVPRKRTRENSSLFLWLGRLGFFAFVFWFWGVRYGDFLYTAQYSDIFIWDGDFFHQNIVRLNGFLYWLTSFIVQFFYIPLLGALILALFLLGIQTLTAAFFKLKGYLYVFSFLPPLLLMLAIPQVNYYLFATFNVAFLFSSIPGIFYVLFSAVVFTKIPQPWCRSSYYIIAFFFTYPLFGFYSLFGAALCALKEGTLSNDTNRNIRCATMLLLLLLVPLCWYPLYAASNAFSWFYVAGLFEESVIDKDLATLIRFYGPFWSCFFVLGFIAFCERISFAFFKKEKQRNSIEQNDLQQNAKPPIWGLRETVLSCVISLLCFATVYGAFSSQNFQVLLKMGPLLERNAWDEILTTEAEIAHPINPLITLRNLALMKTGQLPYRVFERPLHPHVSSQLANVGSFKMLGDRVLFLYGDFNFANWAAMNAFTDQNERSLWMTKTLALCALGNGEKRLAEKYLDRIEKTLFHRNWAKRYQHYLSYQNIPVEEQPESLRSQVHSVAEELASLREIGIHEDYINSVMGLDYLVYLGFQKQNFADRSLQLKEVQLTYLLFLLDFQHFFENLDAYAKELHGKPLPPYFQEAILFYSHYVRPEDAKNISYEISPDVRKRFDQYTAMMRQLPNQPSRDQFLRTKLDRDFPNTFWRHQAFVGEIVNY